MSAKTIEMGSILDILEHRLQQFLEIQQKAFCFEGDKQKSFRFALQKDLNQNNFNTPQKTVASQKALG